MFWYWCSCCLVFRNIFRKFWLILSNYCKVLQLARGCLAMKNRGEKKRGGGGGGGGGELKTLIDWATLILKNQKLKKYLTSY